MPIAAAIGNELAEVPFGDLLFHVAKGIADGQQAMDLTSLQTLIALSNTMVSLIPEVTEVMTGAPFTVPVSGHSGVPATGVQVTGVRVQASAAQPVTMSALQAGIVPTFYQFTEATIQLKLSIQVRRDETTGVTAAFGSHVNFRTKNTYSYAATGSSSVTAIVRPVPSPPRVTPTVITVNALGNTPTVSVTP